MNTLSFFSQHSGEILQGTLEHVWLVAATMALAIAIGVPLVILVARKPWLSKPILGSANIAETIPSLALLGFLLPTPWLGDRADRVAITALTLYALLPIIRNTAAGITRVDPAVREAARGMGMTPRQILFQVELPLSLSTVLAESASPPCSPSASPRSPPPSAREGSANSSSAAWPWSITA